jgi:hypothetical protein
MDSLLQKLGTGVKGVIEGFDRIVFKGMLKPLLYPGGFASFLNTRGVLNKDYKSFVTSASEAIEADARRLAEGSGTGDVTYLPSPHIRKEEVAHELQSELGIREGLIGIWSCVEGCKTFRSVFDKDLGYPQLKTYASRCKHLYFYLDDADYGFMSIRLQTWAPYEIQVALNGREWLRRQLDKSGLGYIIDGNKFLDIEDYGTAQMLLDMQVRSRWIAMLDGFARMAFPSSAEILGERMSYTWTLWQSEWARDYIFRDQQMLDEIMPMYLRHAFISGNADRVLRYMGVPVKADGLPRTNANVKLQTKINQYHDGGRIRHWIGKNSVKMYNEHNVLRFEMTMNDPARFKVHRATEGSDSAEKRLLPMRKGIADITVRTQISAQRINSFTEQVAALTESSTVREMLASLSLPVMDKKRYRGLDASGKDRTLLEAVADSRFTVDAITNKSLRQMLEGTPWANGLSGKQLSARISRNLRLLREHGLIKKEPKQNKYYLTQKGRLVTGALVQCLGARVCDLAKLAA